MQPKKSVAKLKPLFIGRLSRILFGVGTFAVIAVIGPAGLAEWELIALLLLGASFLLGGIMGNPGCEITAIPNLLLPEKKKVHFR